MRLSSILAFSVAARPTAERFASKTAYRSARPQGRPLEDVIDPRTIVHVDVLFRHGSRYPSPSQISQWQLTAQSLIPTYVPRIRAENSYLLSRTGWQEMEELGYKWRELTRPLAHPTFSASSKSRAIASAEAFIFGYYNWTRIFDAWEGIEGSPVDSLYLDVHGQRVFVDDPTLRFFDYDVRYQREVGNRLVKEQEEFVAGEEMRLVAEELSVIIGKNVSVAQSIQLWALTGSEIAIFNSSRLSSLWTSPSQEVLNYATDLKHFYKSGRGHEASILQARPYVRKLLQRLSSPFGQYYAFAHAETLIPVVELIAPVDEEKLTARNFRIPRGFDSSNISPFAANLAVLVVQTTTLNVWLVLNGHIYGDAYTLEEFKELLRLLLGDSEEL